MCREDGISWLKQIILNNLGNSHRKNKEYSQAIECYQASLAINPDDVGVLFALGFCYHLIQEYEKAAEIYPKVIIMKHETHFANTMLQKCWKDWKQNKAMVLN